MIVICTKCQAKFRVADGKIGPRGAKVRCSRCQAVFVVQPDAGAPTSSAPAAVDLEPRAASSAGGPPPSPLDPARLRPPPLPPPLPSRAAVDPFAAAALAEPLRTVPSADPFAAPAADPFAAPAADPFAAPAADPFAAAPAPPSQDPFAAPSDPFAPSARPFPAPSPPQGPGVGGGLPVTDLSALLGAAAGAPREVDAGLPAYGELSAPEPSESSGLSLEERHTPAPLPPPRPEAPPTAFAADPGAVLETAAPGDPFGAGPDPAFDPGGLDLGPAAPSVPAAPLREPAAPPAFASSPEPVAPRASEPGRPPGAVWPPPPSAERLPRTPLARARAVLLNAVALAALLLVALVLLAVWRTEAPLDASALRPGALLAALSREGAAGPFAAREVRAGLYERERGPPVLYVRGKVVSRAPGPVRAVAVKVEVVRDGEVVARGEALAGAVPTAEELWRAPDAEALAAVAAAAAKRVPREVRPGDDVPFLVAIADHPEDLDGASIRVAAAPAPKGAR